MLAGTSHGQGGCHPRSLVTVPGTGRRPLLPSRARAPFTPHGTPGCTPRHRHQVSAVPAVTRPSALCAPGPPLRSHECGSRRASSSGRARCRAAEDLTGARTSRAPTPPEGGGSSSAGRRGLSGHFHLSSSQSHFEIGVSKPSLPGAAPALAGSRADVPVRIWRFPANSSPSSEPLPGRAPRPRLRLFCLHARHARRPRPAVCVATAEPAHTFFPPVSQVEGSFLPST